MAQDLFSFRKWWLRRYHQLTDPSAALHNLQDQYRAQMLATLMAVALIYIPAYALYRVLIGEPEDPITSVTSIICFAFMVITYVFSRTRRFRLGVFIIVVPLSLFAVLQGVVRAPLGTLNLFEALLWVIPIVFFSSIMLPVKLTGLVIVCEALLAAAVFTLQPNIPIVDTHFPFDYTLVFDILFIVSGFLVRRYTRHIENQSRDLAESEERYRSLFESSFVGIVVHENGVIVEANSGLLKSLGYTGSEVIGKPIHRFFVPEHGFDMHTILDTTRSEMLARRQDGSQFFVEIYRKNVTYRGRPAQVLAFHDITEQRQLAENRVKLLAERERSQVLRQFISDVSHDVRTPLATINTSLYLLRRAIADDAKTTRYMDTIEAQAFHLNEVLDSLLLMARLDDPDSYFEMTLLDLNQAVQDVVSTTEPTAVKKHHRVEFHSEVELPPVNGDVDEIKRAIRHILENALQFTPDGGTIVVRTKLLRDEAVIEIQDNGSGISAEDLPHIFQRFYRGDKARGQSMNGGAGLGLPIARKIIETLDGRIDVASQVGSGSTFRIFLPVVLQYAPQI